MSDSDDVQAGAEQIDEEVTGLDEPVTSDEVLVEYPPDHFEGVQFADSDVTDESIEDRSSQEEPEPMPLLPVSPPPPTPTPLPDEEPS